MAGDAVPVPELGASWEEGTPDLTKLDIADKPTPSSAPDGTHVSSNGDESAPASAAPVAAPAAGAAAAPAAPAAAAADPVCDPAIVEALKDPKERQNVMLMEALVESFIGDPSKDVIEFPGNFTNYQRMLAHRVAQYYGLQTSTVDYEDGPGRVIGHRTKFTTIPQNRPSACESKSVTEGRGPQHPSHHSHHHHPPRLLRRPSGEHTRGGPASGDASGLSHLSPQERHADYIIARQRIIGQQAEGGGDAGGRSGRAGGGGGGNGGGLPRGPAPGGGGGGRGRGGDGGGGGRDGDAGAGRGRGRKAVFRDRDRELSDPDYLRGAQRYGGTGYDPNGPGAMQGGMYVPTYQTEFPTLNGLGRTTSATSASGGGTVMYHQQHPQQQQQGGWAAAPVPGFRPPPPPPPQGGGGGGGPQSAKSNTSQRGYSGTPPHGSQQPGGGGGAPPPQQPHTMHPGQQQQGGYPAGALHPAMAHPGGYMAYPQPAGGSYGYQYTPYAYPTAAGMSQGQGQVFYGMPPDGNAVWYPPYAGTMMGAYPGGGGGQPVYIGGMPAAGGQQMQGGQMQQQQQQQLGRAYSGPVMVNGYGYGGGAHEYGAPSGDGKVGGQQQQQQQHSRQASGVESGLGGYSGRGGGGGGDSRQAQAALLPATLNDK